MSLRKFGSVLMVALFVGAIGLHTRASAEDNPSNPIPAASPVPDPSAVPSPEPAPSPVPPPPTSQSERCLTCHQDRLKGKAYVHDGAVPSDDDATGCINCHAPHGQPTRYAHRLKAKANDLCALCHQETMIDHTKGNHPIVGHPVLKMRDPLHPERMFTCISCHNPHASDMPNVFRYNYGPETPYKGSLCAVCHGDKLGVQAHVPAWNQ